MGKGKGKEREVGGGKLITVETKEEGSVSWHVYKRYFQAAGGFLLVSAVIIAYIIENGVKVAADWWLSNWADSGGDPIYYLRYSLLFIFTFAPYFFLSYLFFSSFSFSKGVLITKKEE